MTFAEKLVFLMQLTSTSNKQLAVKVDPSLISLLRSARREAPKNPDYMRAMSAYFAKKCGVGYQRIALSEVMGREQIPAEASPASLADMLFLWLTESHDRIGPLLVCPEASAAASCGLVVAFVIDLGEPGKGEPSASRAAAGVSSSRSAR